MSQASSTTWVPYVGLVLSDKQAATAFATDSSVAALLQKVHAAYGAVSVVFLLHGLQRHLGLIESREERAFHQRGPFSAAMMPHRLPRTRAGAHPAAAMMSRCTRPHRAERHTVQRRCLQLRHRRSAAVAAMSRGCCEVQVNKCTIRE